MKGYVQNLEALAKTNDDFRHVLYSGTHLQLTLMTLQPKQDIGGQTLDGCDQVFWIHAGEGRMIIDGVTHKIAAGDVVVVPAGTHHNLICTGKTPLSLYTIFGPPHHRDQLVQPTKSDAEAAEESFDGQGTETQPSAVLA